jgi:carbamoyltransferase
MLLAFPVREDRRAQIPAVTHVDGSARVQTVTPDENGRFHALLRAFGRRTGVPILLNTSFNVRGEPIVRSPADALDALLRTGLTAVVVGDLVFEKPTT